MALRAGLLLTIMWAAACSFPGEPVWERVVPPADRDAPDTPPDSPVDTAEGDDGADPVEADDGDTADANDSPDADIADEHDADETAEGDEADGEVEAPDSDTGDRDRDTEPPFEDEPIVDTSCSAYCTAALRACTGVHTLFPDAPTCLAQCEKRVTDGVIASGPAIAGNTLACRMKWPLRPDFDQDRDCPRMSFRGGGACGDLPENFCRLANAACVGGNQQYAGIGQCTNFATGLRQGTTDDTGGQNTLYCRYYHIEVAYRSAEDAEIHCPHGGPTGADVCTDTPASDDDHGDHGDMTDADDLDAAEPEPEPEPEPEIDLEPSIAPLRWYPRPETFSGPSATRGARAVADGAGRVYVFTGISTPPGDDTGTWWLDGSAWGGPIPGGPGARLGAAAAFDPVSERIVVFGGYSNAQHRDDTWLFTPGSSVWAPVAGTGPSPREGASMVYDTARNRIVLVGGYDGTSARSDTWVLNGGVWSEVTTATGLPQRWQAAVAYDPDRDRVVLFGGVGASPFPTDELYEFDGAQWRSIPKAGDWPSARSDAVMVWHAEARVVLLIGGGDGSGNPLRDVWAWNGARWSQPVIPPVPAPFPARERAAAYDGARRRVVLIGGQSPFGPTNSVDVLAYDIAAGLNDVAITEVMPAPANVVLTAGQWVEITERSGSAFALTGWRLYDARGNPESGVRFDGSDIIGGNGRLVLARNTNGLLNGGIAAEKTLTFALGGATPSRLVLEDDRGIVRALGFYPGGARTGVAFQFDLSRLTSAAADPASWCEAPASATFGTPIPERGTPGSLNPPCPTAKSTRPAGPTPPDRTDPPIGRKVF